MVARRTICSLSWQHKRILNNNDYKTNNDMKDFNFYAPTEVVFGENSEERVALLIKKYGGTKVLVHYGGKSAERRTGI